MASQRSLQVADQALFNQADIDQKQFGRLISAFCPSSHTLIATPLLRVRDRLRAVGLRFDADSGPRYSWLGALGCGHFREAQQL